MSLALDIETKPDTPLCEAGSWQLDLTNTGGRDPGVETRQSNMIGVGVSAMLILKILAGAAATIAAVKYVTQGEHKEAANDDEEQD